jgi:hypothetical protein
MTHHTFTQKEVFTSAWNKVQEHGWYLFTIYFLAVLFLSTVSFGPAAQFLFELGVSAKVAGIVELFMKLIMYYVVCIALLNSTLRLVKDNRASYEDLVSPFKSAHTPLTYTGTSLIFTVILFACFAAIISVLGALSLGLQPGAVITAKSYVIIAGTSALLLVGGYLAIRFMFYKLFIISNSSTKAIDALKHSYVLTQGKDKSIISFTLTALVFNILGILAFGLGLIITVPVTITAYTIIFKKLTHTE